MAWHPAAPNRLFVMLIDFVGKLLAEMFDVELFHLAVFIVPHGTRHDAQGRTDIGRRIGHNTVFFGEVGDLKAAAFGAGAIGCIGTDRGGGPCRM